jgi:tetratricopeptide (TPR) repeat protein
MRMRNGDYSGAIRTLREMRASLLTDGKLPDDPSEAALYADAGSWLTEVLNTTGHNQEAAALTQESLQIIEQILQNHPGHLEAIRLRERINAIDGQGLAEQRKARASLAVINTALRDTEYVARIDPDDGGNRDNHAINLGFVAQAYFALGQPQAGQQVTQQLLALYQEIQPNPYQSTNLLGYVERVAINQAELNQLPELQQSVALLRRYTARAGEAQADRARFDLDQQRRELQLDLQSGARPVTAPAVAALLAQARQQVLEAQQKNSASSLFDARAELSQLLSLDVDAALERGDALHAATSSQELVQMAADFPDTSEDAWTPAYLQHSLALSGVGRHGEALTFARKALRNQRAHTASGADDLYLRIELAQSLYAAALAQPQAGQPELAEARALLASLPEVMRQYRSVKLWRKRIKTLQRERSQ